jgi:hypothetical protein
MDYGVMKSPGLLLLLLLLLIINRIQIKIELVKICSWGEDYEAKNQTTK